MAPCNALGLHVQPRRCLQQQSPRQRQQQRRRPPAEPQERLRHRIHHPRVTTLPNPANARRNAKINATSWSTGICAILSSCCRFDDAIETFAL